MRPRSIPCLFSSVPLSKSKIFLTKSRCPAGSVSDFWMKLTFYSLCLARRTAFQTNLLVPTINIWPRYTKKSTGSHHMAVRTTVIHAFGTAGGSGQQTLSSGGLTGGSIFVQTRELGRIAPTPAPGLASSVATATE